MLNNTGDKEREGNILLLELQGLTKYFGGLVAVNNVSLSIKRGEIVGLIGANGAGKTTLFNIISGVYPPSRGRVLCKGEDITGLKPHRVAQKGVVRTFQLTSLFREETVLQNILLGFHLTARPSLWEALFNTASKASQEKRLLEKALEIVEFMGLSQVRNELAKNLPYGDQRALGIAIALGVSPELLMLDEPVSGMNPEETRLMMDRIRRIHERGITLFIVEHHMKMVMGICERVCVQNFGVKVAEGSPEEISKNDEVIACYLGKEYVTEY